MNKDEILLALQKEVATYNNLISTDKGDWIIKGFIDLYKNVYTITLDTKVVSKVMEILLIPAFAAFAEKNNLELCLPPQQNFYPDLSFTCKETNAKFAVDIKSTFRDTKGKISGMTLGAYSGYFRNRTSSKNTLHPYGEYSAHIVLGVIYSQDTKKPDERKKYTVDELDQIRSVIKDFQFFVQPKWKIASTNPGSGNTKNIGSTNKIDQLLDGTGVFSTLGEAVYDDYWMNYMNKAMAKDAGMPEQPYTNLLTYTAYKKKGKEALALLEEHEGEIEKLSKDAEQDGSEIE